MRFRLKFCCFLPLALVFSAALVAQTVQVDTTQVLNRINPRTALGSGVDRIPIQAIDHDFTSGILKQVFDAGWQPVTYRQNTDLEIEAWHWNPVGTWSESGDKGYFTGSTTSTGFIRYSYGYGLPHRGFTRNDGTGPVGYSRLTDGDLNTYWKSNPYLSSRFTGESDSLHPQWVIVDLSYPTLVDTLKIAWGAPYAKKYLVQYWNGKDPFHFPTLGVWTTFPAGAITDGAGGTVTLRLSRVPMKVQFVRILMTESSNTCDDQGPSDPRNCVGYAMREIYMGTTSRDDVFHDVTRHTPDQEQTATYCSSVDPWHTSKSQVNIHQAQVGFDLFYKSGVTQGLPPIIPIAMLYDTPDNAAAEIRYLEEHKYPIADVEMGEESDGQFFQPEDYGALYIQFARALHKIDPNLKLGGPSFEGVNKDIKVWPDAEGRTSWLRRFLDYLRAHHAMNELSFFSFEHYPYTPCTFNWASLYDEPELITHIVQVWHDDGLPPSVPLYLTESNLSSATSESYMDIFGGLWLADYIGSYLEAGGNKVFYFHYLPLRMEPGCNNSPGTFSMFKVGPSYQIEQRLSQFYASRMINFEWLQHEGENTVYPATAVVDDGAGHKLVMAYAVHRADGLWSVMLVNQDQHVKHTVKVVFEKDGKAVGFAGPLHEAVFGSEQYHWHPALTESNAHAPIGDVAATAPVGGFAEPDGPIAEHEVTGGKDTEYDLPPASIIVLRGKLAPF
jgi:F5/8 type C domain